MAGLQVAARKVVAKPSRSRREPLANTVPKLPRIRGSSGNLAVTNESGVLSMLGGYTAVGSNLVHALSTVFELGIALLVPAVVWITLTAGIYQLVRDVLRRRRIVLPRSARSLRRPVS